MNKVKPQIFSNPQECSHVPAPADPTQPNTKNEHKLNQKIKGPMLAVFAHFTTLNATANQPTRIYAVSR